MFASGMALGHALCEALGLDPMAVSALTVSCTTDGAATVLVQFAIDVDNVAGLAAAVAEYELQPKSGEGAA